MSSVIRRSAQAVLSVPLRRRSGVRRAAPSDELRRHRRAVDVGSEAYDVRLDGEL